MDTTSADIYTAESHLAGKPESTLALYDAVMQCINSIGPVTVDPKKTCIHVNRKTALAGIRIRKDYIILEFKTDYPIDSPQLNKTEQISRNRFHHTVIVKSADSLTAEVQGWLRDVYDLSA